MSSMDFETEGSWAARPVSTWRTQVLRIRTLFAERANAYFWGGFALVLALMSWNSLWRLGLTFVRDCDEARYGVAASEMLHTHSLLVTTYGGTTEFWNLKPPLGYWLIELSYRLIGETPFGLRLPSALCAIITTGLTMLLGCRMAGRSAGVLAGAIMATSFGFLAHHGARSGELDCCLTLLLLIFLMLAPQLGDSRPERLAAGLVLALGFLLKSFAILPSITAVALYYILRRGVASWRIWLAPVGVILAVGTTWAVARSVAEGSWEFVHRMFLEDLLLRATTEIDPGVHNAPWDYLGVLVDRLAPWPLVAVLACAVARYLRRPRLGAESSGLLWAYALVPLALFSLARTHHFWYVTPTYPAWAILAAAGTLDVLQVLRTRAEVVAAAVAAFLAFCLVVGEVRIVTHMAYVYDRMPPSQAFLATLRGRLSGPGLVIDTDFTPSYSERFFLQVVDGFDINDTEHLGRGGSHTASAPDALLIKRPGEMQPMNDGAARPAKDILAESNDFALIRLSSR